MKILIVDDEKPARDRLRQLIEDFDEYEVVAEAGNGDHLVLVEVLEQLPQPVARRLFIVDDQYLHRSLMHGLPRTGNAGSP